MFSSYPSNGEIRIFFESLTYSFYSQLPDKSIASLVKFYYSWKKTRSRTSVMDRQEKRRNDGATDNGSDDTPDNSDVEDKVSSQRKI